MRSAASRSSTRPTSHTPVRESSAVSAAARKIRYPAPRGRLMGAEQIHVKFPEESRACPHAARSPGGIPNETYAANGTPTRLALKGGISDMGVRTHRRQSGYVINDKSTRRRLCISCGRRNYIPYRIKAVGRCAREKATRRPTGPDWANNLGEAKRFGPSLAGRPLGRCVRIPGQHSPRCASAPRIAGPEIAPAPAYGGCVERGVPLFDP